LKSYRKTLLSKEQDIRTKLNKKSFNVHLDALNDEPDVQLKITPKERMHTLLDIGKAYNWILDLRGHDLARVELESFDISQNVLILTPEQERQYLSDAQKRQKYSKFFEFVAAGDITQ